MKLIFVCPEKNQTFETDDYRIIEDKGVRIEDSDNKVWDTCCFLN